MEGTAYTGGIGGGAGATSVARKLASALAAQKPAASSPRLRQAQVTAVALNKMSVSVVLTGAAAADGVKFLSSYVPVAGDLVWVLTATPDILVLGKLVDASTQWVLPTLINGWLAYGGGFSTPGYMRDSSGIVHLRGLVKNGVIGAGTAGTIFTLPIGFRPEFIQLLPSTASLNVFARTDVDTAGNVVASSTAGTNGFWSLDGISFAAL